MRRGGSGIGKFTKLMGVRIVGKAAREETHCENEEQSATAEEAKDALGVHDGLSCIVPARKLTPTVRRVTKSVMLVSKGKSRLRAACQANCPIPGESERASKGIAAPSAMLAETPRRATRGCHATGITWQKRMRLLLTPRARAASTKGR